LKLKFSQIISTALLLAPLSLSAATLTFSASQPATNGADHVVVAG